MDPFRIQIAATFTAEPVTKSLEFLLGMLRVPAEISFAPFNQVFQELLDPGSAFAQNRQGVNVLLLRLEDLAANPVDIQKLVTRAQELSAAMRAGQERFRVPTLLVVCPPSNGTLAADAFRTQVSRTEASLTAELHGLQGLHLISSHELGRHCPVAEYDYPRGHALGAVPYTQRFYHLLGRQLARIVHRLATLPRKVIVLDCDQTLWKGVCGEDGPQGVEVDAPRRFLQEFMVAQCTAGMVLCLCSKNNEADVWEVFDQRTDMLLRRDHIVAWRINWERKSENIKSLARELQLGLDSFIFVDDDAVVCADVQTCCPEVLTIRVPEEAALIPEYFRQHWAFDHLAVTAEDRKRTEMYRANVGRNRLLETAVTLDDFLRNLELKCDIAPLSGQHLSRVAQLTQRTNQFNVNPVRRNEVELQQLLKEGAECLVVHVSDRFGDYGLVGAVIYRRNERCLLVDTFLISCRVLGRGIEHRMLSALGRIATNEHQEQVVVRFVPTKKNRPAADFLECIGNSFQQTNDLESVFRFPASVALEMSPAKVKLTTAAVEPVSKVAAPLPAVEANSVWLARADALHEIAAELHQLDKLIARLEPETAQRSGIASEYVAPRTKTESELVEIWQHLLKVNPVGVFDDYFKLGGDSLMAVSLFVEIEERFGRQLPLATLFTSPTVSALAAYLNGREPERQWRYLVPIQTEGSRPPLYCLHAAGGNILFYRDLARHLGSDQPVYGLQAREMPDTGTYLDTVEAMAAEYLKEIVEFQPHGPFYVCGSSFGGLLAYEIAQQLAARNHTLALVALFDTYGPGYPKPLPSANQVSRGFLGLVDRLNAIKGQLAQLEAGARWAFISSKAKKAVMKYRRKLLYRKNEFDLKYAQKMGGPLPKDLQRNHRAIRRALDRYVPKPCAAKLTLFRAAEQPKGILTDPHLGWGALAINGIEVIESPGAYGGMTVDPHARRLAEHLRVCLRRIDLSAAPAFDGTTAAAHDTVVGRRLIQPHA
jgi:FkbH-like protein